MISISQRQPNWPLAGYAPGSYLNHCLTCGDYYYGDKRAIECLPCAVDTVKSKLTETRSFCDD